MSSEETVKGRCDLCCCDNRNLTITHGMEICDECMEEIPYIDSDGFIWRWGGGQCGDECVKCGKDISEMSDVLLNDETGCFIVMCPACAGIIT